MNDRWEDDEPEVLRLGKMLDELDKNIDVTDIRNMREALIESLYLIQKHTDHGSRVLVQLAEALRLANRGKLHPLFATRQADKDRAESSESIAAVEATAAAIIHYQKTERGIPKHKTSKDIADYLSKKGYRYAGNKEYQTDTISRLPSKYEDPNEQGHADYLAALDMLYKYQLETNGLGLIGFILENSLIQLNPKKRRKY